MTDSNTEKTHSDDFVEDYESAHFDSMQRVAGDLRVMGKEDDNAYRYSRHMSRHPVEPGCLVCADRSVGLATLLNHLSCNDESLDSPDLALFPREIEALSRAAALHDTSGRRRLRTLEAIGDSALSTVLSIVVNGYDWDVSVYQQARTSCTSNYALAGLFNSSPLRRYVSFTGDVSTAVGTAGAKTLEAVLGFVCLRLGLRGVFWVSLNLGILSLFTFPNSVDAMSMAISARLPRELGYFN